MEKPYAFTINYMTKSLGLVSITIESSAPYLDLEEMIAHIRPVARIEVPEKSWDWPDGVKS